MARAPKKQTYPGKVKLREKQMKDGSRSLYLDTWHEGKRQYEFLSLYLTGHKLDDIETRRLAESIRAKREVELQGGRYEVTPTHYRKMNFLDYYDRVVKGEIDGKPKGKNWASARRKFEAYAGESLTFEQMTARKLEGFRAFLVASLASGTAHHYFALIASVLRKATKDGLIRSNPAEGVEAIPIPESNRVFLTIEELRKLNDTPCRNEVVKRAFMFSAYTGLRRCDVREMRWGDIEGGRLTYRPRKTQSSRGNIETIPLSPQALELAGERGEPTRPVFPLPSDSGIAYMILRWVQKAGITKTVGFHTARHSFATLALTSGSDIYMIRDLLGHADIKTTMAYAKIIDSKKIEAVNLIPSLTGDANR